MNSGRLIGKLPSLSQLRALYAMPSRLKRDRHLSPQEGATAKACKRLAVWIGLKAALGFLSCSSSTSLVPKLCFGTHHPEALLRPPQGQWIAPHTRNRFQTLVSSQTDLDVAIPRSRASRKCVPKQSFGTRGKSEQQEPEKLGDSQSDDNPTRVAPRFARKNGPMLAALTVIPTYAVA